MRRGWFAFEGDGVGALEYGAFAVDGLAHAVDDAAKPAFVRHDGGRFILDNGAAAETDAIKRAEGHEQRVAVFEADDFAGDVIAVMGAQMAHRADGQRGAEARDFHEEAENLGDFAIHFGCGDFVDVGLRFL